MPSPFLKKHSKKPPTFTIRCLRRYALEGAWNLRKIHILFMLIIFSSQSLAVEGCKLDNSSEVVIKALFSKPENIYSLLWWDDVDGKNINARSFIINGKDSIPIFDNESEAKKQIAGSGFEKDLVSVKPGLLAGILQGMEYAVLNPGGAMPIQFKSCAVKQYVGSV